MESDVPPPTGDYVEGWDLKAKATLELLDEAGNPAGGFNVYADEAKTEPLSLPKQWDLRDFVGTETWLPENIYVEADTNFVASATSPRACKLVATLESVKGEMKDTVPIKATEFKLRNDVDILKGFDSTSEKKWTSVAAGEINALVKFVDDTGRAEQGFEVAPREGEESYASVLDGAVTSKETLFQIKGGKDLAAATLTLKRSGTWEGTPELGVWILPWRTVPIGIYRVSDPDSPRTALPGSIPSDAAIIEKLNEVFQQAKVRFELHPSSGSKSVKYDLDTNGSLNGGDLTKTLGELPMVWGHI